MTIFLAFYSTITVDVFKFTQIRLNVYYFSRIDVNLKLIIEIRLNILVNWFFFCQTQRYVFHYILCNASVLWVKTISQWIISNLIFSLFFKWYFNSELKIQFNILLGINFKYMNSLIILNWPLLNFISKIF